MDGEGTVAVVCDRGDPRVTAVYAVLEGGGPAPPRLELGWTRDGALVACGPFVAVNRYHMGAGTAAEMMWFEAPHASTFISAAWSSRARRVEEQSRAIARARIGWPLSLAPALFASALQVVRRRPPRNVLGLAWLVSGVLAWAVVLAIG